MTKNPIKKQSRSTKKIQGKERSLKRKQSDQETSRILFDHLVELRSRLFWSFGTFFVALGVAYPFSERILGYLARPLTQLFLNQQGRRFIYTHLSEAFMAYLKTAFFTACLLACPIWAYHIWQFVKPALLPHERRFYQVIFLMIPLLFMGGAALAYYGICPMAWRFFLSFEATKFLDIPMQFEAKISEYLGLTLKLMTTFGLSFQLPILLSILVAFKVLHIETLKKGRKYAFLIMTIIAAIITPPDLISPFGLILPVYGLYELTLLWLSWVLKDRELMVEKAL